MAGVLVQAQSAPTPFKLGTFEYQGRRFVGVVVRESIVIDFAAARGDGSSARDAPIEMRDVISRYPAEHPPSRIVEVLQRVEASGQISSPAYVHDVGAVKVLPPIMYPMTMLNVAVNYREHDIEMARVRQGAPGQTAATAGGGAARARPAHPGIWERQADNQRWNPFMFLKAPTAIVAEGEAVRIPPGRTQIEWECELGAVIGRAGVARTDRKWGRDVFGYTLPERHLRPWRARRHALRVGLARDEESRHVRTAGSVHHPEGIRPGRAATGDPPSR